MARSTLHPSESGLSTGRCRELVQIAATAGARHCSEVLPPPPVLSPAFQALVMVEELDCGHCGVADGEAEELPDGSWIIAPFHRPECPIYRGAISDIHEVGRWADRCEARGVHIAQYSTGPWLLHRPEARAA